MTNTPREFDGMMIPPFIPLLENPLQRFEAIRDMDTRKDDILLVAYPKSGTHWTWEVLNMLAQGKAEYVKKSKVSSFIEAIPDFIAIEEVESPRVLNTHVPFRWLTRKHIQNGGKIVHVIRNPKDVLVSAYHHLATSHDDKGFPWSAYFNMSMEPVKLYDGWCKYEKDYEKAKKSGELKSIHTLYYEDMKKKPQKEIRRLAEYLEVECSDELVKDIADKTDFKKLKEANVTVKVNAAQELAAVVHDAKYPNIYRKGEIGDWKNHFTVAQNEQFDAVIAEEMANSDIKVTFE